MPAAFCFLLHAMARAARHVHLLKALYFVWLWLSCVTHSHVSDRVIVWKDGGSVLHLNRPINTDKTIPLVF